ncbi:beta strand repeat-containing protein [Oleiharenicola lentus]|uniref:beta strand repeat-containing protein n=1 Tax=Oleiharenicola lentus TaxID=2508720 RepID=UPI003F678C61
MHAPHPVRARLGKPRPLRAIAIFFALSFVTQLPLAAQFTGAFAFSNWTFENGATYAPGTTPGSITFDGNSSFTLVGSLNYDDLRTFARFSLGGLTESYRVSFKWEYETFDAYGPQYDPVGFQGAAGVDFQLSDNSGSNTQSGTRSDVYVESLLSFFVDAENWSDPQEGTGSLRIYDFSYTLAAVSDTGDEPNGNDDGGGGPPDPDPVGPAEGMLLWNGSASASFATASNWTDLATSDPAASGPTSVLAAVIVDSGAPVTISNETATAYSLTLDNSALTVSDSTLTIGGNFMINNSAVTVTNSVLTTATHPPGFGGPATVIDNGGSLTLNNSTWTNGSHLAIGNTGAGSLELNNGTTATVASLTTALDADSSATMTITGAGTTLTTLGGENNEDILGYYGASSVTVSAGAHYNSDAIILGYQTRETASLLTVTGTGSELNVTNQLSVGNFGSGTLLVENGGVVNTGNAAIVFGALGDADDPIPVGIATVTGAGSRWNIVGESTPFPALGIGAIINEDRYTQGTLNITDGGLVSVQRESSSGLVAGNVEIDPTGTLNIGTGGLAGTLEASRVRNAGAIVFNHTDDVTFDVRIDNNNYYPGAGTLTKSGSGTLTLNRTGNFAGETVITGGKIVLGHEDALSRSTLNYDQQGGTLSFGTQTYVNLGGLAGSQNLALTNENTDSVTLAVGHNNASTTYSGALSGDGQLEKYGTGTLTLTGINTHTGLLYIDQGTVALSGAGTIGGSSTAAQLMPDGILDLGGKSVAINTVYLFGGTIQNGTFSTTGFSPNAGTINAVIAGTGGLDKYTTGTVTLTAANTYTGTTNVENGTLVVNGSLAANGITTVNTSGRLSGSGSVGTLFVVDGGTLAPGNSPGTLSAASTTWEAGGSYQWEIANATGARGTHYDLLSITGTLNLNALTAESFELSLISLVQTAGVYSPGNVINFNAALNYSYTIATTTGGIFGFDAADFRINTSGFSNHTLGGTWNLALGNSNKDLTLNFTASAIPEPSTYAALFGALVLGLALYRKRRAT